MDQAVISGIMYDAVMTIITVGAPLLLVALVIGVIVSIFQATTQINEQTLIFVPKIIGIFLVILLLGDWMLTKLSDFTLGLFDQILRIVN
jgi:flagellar biosynthesis protein FliQ